MSTEKRAILAIAVSFLILVAWGYLFPPPKPVRAPDVEVVERTPEPAPPRDTASPDAAVGEERPEPADAVGETSPAIAASEEREVRVQTGLLEVVLTNRGARVVSWKLLEYERKDGRPVDLVPGFAVREDLLPFALDLGDEGLNARVNEALFEVAREDLSTGGERIRFTWSDGGTRVEKSLVFRNEDYLVDIAVHASDRGRARPALVTWGPGFEAGDPSGLGRFSYKSQAVFNVAGQVTRQARNKVSAEAVIPETGRLRWAGLEDQYFAALILPAGERGGAVIRAREIAPEPAAGEDPPDPEPQVSVSVSVASEGARLFVGPKKYSLLRSLGSGLEGVVWFSSIGLIAWLAKVLFLALVWIHDNVAANYGLAIIAATVAMRLVLFPLNQYSMVSMRKMQSQMQRLQPKINAIKNKYRKQKDTEGRRKMNEEMMALYRKEGVNPMGSMSGCLPMFAQFPILIAFYNMLTVAVELRGAPFFGWIQDLTLKDPFYVTPLLMGATMFLQQKMTTTKIGDPMQQRIMMMMPVVFTVMFLNLPSGLVLYWFVNNVLGIGQQWLVNRHIGRLEAATQKA